MAGKIVLSSEWSGKSFRCIKNEIYEGGIWLKSGFIRNQLVTEKDIEDLFRCSTIGIGGGDTFVLAKTMQKFGLFDGLRQFYNNGGDIYGMSAGAIVCTPTTMTAQWFDKYHEDENHSGISLVDFVIKPHADESRCIALVTQYQKFCDENNVIMKCIGQEGKIVVENDTLKESGVVVTIHPGDNFTIDKYKRAILWKRSGRSGR